MTLEATQTRTNEPSLDRSPLVLDRYHVVGFIGQGGMGTVYKAYHASLKRFVAIKTLRLDLEAKEMVGRFLREMEMVGQLDHPNVVRAMDAGEKNGVLYIVMEYLNGLNLSRLVAKRGALLLPQACDLVRQTALGLDYIHQKLVHRDVKPSNLMLTDSRQLKILDLGLARYWSPNRVEKDLTPSGMAIGTFSYIAPEQAASGASVDTRADIYSLGCTLYMLLTGQAPFAGPDFDSAAKQLYAHCNICITTRPAFETLPSELKPILARMVAKVPDARFQTAREVAAALEPFARPCDLAALCPELEPPPVEPVSFETKSAELRLLTEAPPATAPGSSQQPTSRMQQAVRRGAIVAMCSAVAAIVVVAVLYMTNKQQGDPRPPAVAPAKPRLLDSLDAHVYHPMLSEPPPLPVGFDTEQSQKWRWESKLHQLETRGWDNLFFVLGESSRARCSFQTSITQMPWTGGVGVLWGYQEDAEQRKAKNSVDGFASFQYLRLERTVGPDGESKHLVHRGIGKLKFNKLGEIARNLMDVEHQQLFLPAGEALLEIEIEGDRLARASLAGTPLAKLCSKETNDLCAGQAYQGGIGVFSLQQFSATFGNVRFMSKSVK